MSISAQSNEEVTTIDLKDPLTAGTLAWLIPGAGHFYQGRRGKAALFAICILGTFFYGLFLGGGRVVYASWRPGDRRLPYLCQVGAGIPALPALVQAYRVGKGKPPLWNALMAPPRLSSAEHHLDLVTPSEMTLSDLTKKYHRGFEIGTVFTMVAGLLNILAIYDAWCGPVIMEEEPPDEARKSKKK